MSTTTERVEAINKDIRQQLFQKGVKGLKGLARTFQTADADGSGQLDDDEFEEALGAAGVFLRGNDLSILFRFYDASGDGNISYDEFVTGLAAPLNERRAGMVQKVFRMMDRDGSGMITGSDIGHVYNVSQDPAVLKGQKTKEEVLAEFLRGFEGARGNGDGQISWQEWSGYYRDMSASIPSDDFFIAKMEAVWQVREDGAPNELDERLDNLCKMLREKVRQKTKGGTAKATLQRAFKFFDKDESGAVSKDEFNCTMMNFGISLEAKDTTAFFNRFDPDRSGTITYEEFSGQLFEPEDFGK